MHPKTEPTVVAVYGRWGSGKSTFMKLLRQRMREIAAMDEAAGEARLQGKAEKWWYYLTGTGVANGSPQAGGEEDAASRAQEDAAKRAQDKVTALYKQYRDKKNPAGQRSALKTLKRLSRPRLLEVWFNACEWAGWRAGAPGKGVAPGRLCRVAGWDGAVLFSAQPL